MRSPRRGAAARDCLDWDERIVSLFQVYFSKRACWNSGRGADRTSVQAATFCTIGCARPHVAVFAAARISSSFLKASFLQSFAFRRRNSRSFSSPVRAAYHSHWQACSKHSAMVGEMVYLLPRPCLILVLTRQPACPALVAQWRHAAINRKIANEQNRVEQVLLLMA
jgi:hypothetical protein